ncbi:FAD:protein FMN transferase [Nevskia soli]|uniref:FAD:protein FMN transferase n=1 Tax=Nevskia soli TaxID=418856 RepID=UPI00068BAA9A|nr:FAD:protein FMN transferase [Nevskia soli]
MPSPSPSTEIRRARPLLGTLVEIRATAAGPRAPLHAAIDAAFAAVEQVHRLMSFHDAGSEVAALNREALHRSLRVDAQTWTVLAAARRLSQLSEGAFDISIGVHLQDWGYLPSGPGPIPSEGNWADIELLDDARVRFHRPLRIDLGGIAKGYAVDCAIAVLREAGIDSALVNAGGDLRVLGPPQQVQLRHPQNPAFSAHALSLCNEALATSANYYARRTSASGEVSPLLDPRSRRPWLGAASVSVRAADCMSADALTKVVLFAAPETAARVLEACDARAYVQNPLEAAA